MTTRTGRLVLTTAPLVALLALSACSEEPRDPARPETSTSGGETEGAGAETPPSSPTTGDEEETTAPPPGATEDPTPTEAAVEVLATGFEVPWGLVVLDEGTVVVGERDTAQVWWVPPGGDP